MNLIALVYNLKRTMNIMGIDKMLNALKKWTPDYRKALCALKTATLKRVFSYKQPRHFLHLQLVQLKIAA